MLDEGATGWFGVVVLLIIFALLLGTKAAQTPFNHWTQKVKMGSMILWGVLLLAAAFDTYEEKILCKAKAVTTAGRTLK